MTYMSTPMIVLVCAASTLGPLATVLAFTVIPARVRMNRRARSLLAGHPGAEQKSVYLELHSAWASRKQKEIDAKIAEMQPQGWAFLRASEASPLRTIRSWGGGLTLYFIRTND
jgi:hypothetical protein